MKKLLAVVSLVVSGVISEAPAPYPPSGWRPDGPAFDLPQKTQILPTQRQQYLPPVDPRRPLTPNNFDDADVSVQGLPIIEQQPIFEVSPINGQQYTGPSINADIGRLNPNFQQIQYQQQLEKARQFARQREFENSRARVPSNGLPNQQSPRQFASQTTTTTQKPEFKTTQAETTTESIELNGGEILDDSRDPKAQKQQVSVEVSKQNLQEYPAELFLSSLAQLKLQPQFVPLSQFGQLRAPLIIQPAQPLPVQGFDGPAHLSALPSVLAQKELLSQQSQFKSKDFTQNPIIVQQEQKTSLQEPVDQYRPEQPSRSRLPVEPVQPQRENQPEDEPSPQFKQPNQYQQPQLQFQPQPQLQLQPQLEPSQYPQPQLQYQPQPQLQYQPQLAQPNQFQQPQFQYQPQPQLQIQPQLIQPNQFPQPQLVQPNQFSDPQPQLNQFPQPQRPKDVEEIEQNDQQVVYQNYQPQFYQPQFQPANQYQNAEQPLFLAQPAFAYQNQEQVYQNQIPQQQYDPSQLSQQDGQPLQSSLDINQQGNGIDQTEEQEQDDEQDEEEGPRATAVATAFGTRQFSQ